MFQMIFQRVVCIFCSEGGKYRLRLRGDHTGSGGRYHNGAEKTKNTGRCET